jgi:uncharacterized protein YutE (UPF0331/DUF86 family)
MDKTDRDELRKKIRIKLSSMERRLGGLMTRLKAVTEEEFQTSELLEEFAFARLYKTSQDMVELASLMLLWEEKTPPQETSERLKLLQAMGILPADLTNSLLGMEHFFGTLSDCHEELEDKDLYRFATVDAYSLLAFSEKIRDYLVEQSGYSIEWEGSGDGM